MNDWLFADLKETSPSKAPTPPAQKSGARVKAIDRSQMVWRSVDVERLVEEDHPARAIWELSGQLDLRPFYAPIAVVQGTAGRAASDPRLLISLWIYGLSRGISSARELARRCEYEPAFQWLCGLEPINYHTLSDFRTHDGPALQELFVQVLGVLSAQKIVNLERVMHDGTKIQAQAGRDSFHREATLQAHLAAARQEVEKLSAQNQEELTAREAAARQRAARQREERLNKALEQLEQIRQGKSSPEQKQEARVSLSDPEARNMKQPGGGYAPSYNVQISTEASHKIIVGLGVSQNGSDYGELVGAMQRVEENLQAKPAQVVVDGGFTSRENIQAMASQAIDMIGATDQPSPSSKTSPKEGAKAAVPGPLFTAQNFTYNAQQDQYACPAGQILSCVREDKRRPGVVEYNYRAPQSSCQTCLLKTQCCPESKTARLLVRAVESPEVQVYRQKMQSEQAQEIYRQRAPVAEFPNAWIKEKLGIRKFRLRSVAKVEVEVLWAGLTYNIQQWIRLCWRKNLKLGMV